MPTEYSKHVWIFKAYIKVFDMRRLYYFIIKISFIIRLKCYYETIYLEILEFLVIPKIIW